MCISPPHPTLNPHSSKALEYPSALNLNTMNFTASTLTAVDFTTLQQGSVANATLKSFNYQSGFCFGTFVADGQSVRAIIGSKEDCPIKDMLAIKGLEVEITFGGTKVSNGVTYPKYYVAF